MELNTRGRYAVMAMADIADQHRQHSILNSKAHAVETCVDGSIPLSQIAGRQQISLPYLEQLFLKLRRAGLVESARGRTGGYRLARPANTITVAEIMSAVEEGVRMTRCQGEDGTPCLSGQRCLTHGLWQALGTSIHQFLTDVTLQQVIDGSLDRRHTSAGPAPRSLFTGGLPR